MGPGNSSTRDLLWGLDSSQLDTMQIRVFGHLSTYKNVPERIKVDRSLATTTSFVNVPSS